MKLRKSYIWAGVISLGIAGWLASGELLSTPTPVTTEPEKPPTPCSGSRCAKLGPSRARKS